MHRLRIAAALALVWAGSVAQGRAQEAPAAPLPVREVTVFKDGHALVVAEGSLPVSGGKAVLDTLPQPVMGAFWPYAVEKGVTLASVTAGYRTVAGTRPAQMLRELLKANVGKRATLRETTGEPYAGTIEAVLGDNPGQPSLLLFRTDAGVKAIDTAFLRDAVFPESVVATLPQETRQPRLTLTLDGVAGARTAVGVMYLQKGLRWIPHYRIELDGKGQASVRLQATLINELTDLDGVTANLVVGVPSVAFQDQLDPIALQQTVAQLSPFFQADARTSNALSMGQMARMGEVRDQGDGGGGPQVDGAERAEDLFLFTVRNVRLKKGERMTLPVASFTLPYRDVYTLDLLPALPNDPRFSPGNPGGELARLLARPKARHQIRLTNTSPYPLTTGPALLLSQGKMIAQGMTTYTARGGTSDVALTDATEIVVKRVDRETGRTPNALESDGSRYARVEMDGAVTLTSYLPVAAEIEVTRYVPGKVSEARDGGVASVLDPLADDELPGWWGSYGGIAERTRFTGLGKVTWKATLPPGGKSPVALRYAWHWFTR